MALSATCPLQDIDVIQMKQWMFEIYKLKTILDSMLFSIHLLHALKSVCPYKDSRINQLIKIKPS